jgi:hypothetical protein
MSSETSTAPLSSQSPIQGSGVGVVVAEGVAVKVGPPGVIVGVEVAVGPPGVIVGVEVAVGPPGVLVGVEVAVGTPEVTVGVGVWVGAAVSVGVALGGTSWTAAMASMSFGSRLENNVVES